MASNYRLTGYDPAGTTGIQTAIAGTALNGLANGAYAWGPEIDNSADLMPYGTLTLALSGGSVALTAPAYWAWYLVEPDAAGNYEATAGDPGLSQWLGNVRVTGTTITNLPAFAMPVLLPPKFKLVALNSLGAALPSSATHVSQLRRRAEQSL